LVGFSIAVEVGDSIVHLVEELLGRSHWPLEQEKGQFLLASGFWI